MESSQGTHCNEPIISCRWTIYPTIVIRAAHMESTSTWMSTISGIIIASNAGKRTMPPLLTIEELPTSTVWPKRTVFYHELVITVANILSDMDKMKIRSDNHWREVSSLLDTTHGLEHKLDSEVEAIASDRVGDLENEVRDLQDEVLGFDALLSSSHQNKAGLLARIYDLEAQVDGLCVAWINFCQKQQNADENTNDKSR